MEMELNNLIEKIKKDGVKEAEKQAQEIIAQAQAQAKNILNKAQKDSKDLLDSEKEEIRNFQSASHKALQQAARDVLLSLRSRAVELADRILKQEISDKFTPETLQKIIIKVIENFKDNSAELEVLVSQEDCKTLERVIFSGLAKEIKNRVSLKGVKSIEKGFRIGKKGENSYFDFSDEALVQAFKRFLNPKLVEILDIGPEHKS